MASSPNPGRAATPGFAATLGSDLRLSLGIDLGTSAVKTVLIGADGAVYATGTAPLELFADTPGQAEQSPADWVTAVHAALSGMNQLSDWRTRVAAIGLTGQLPTLVCANRTGPLGRAITWKDSRADQRAAAMIDARDRRGLYEHTGMPIDGRYLGPMFCHHWRERRAAVEFVFSAKDYLCYVLTGQHVTDPSTAAGYGVFDLATGSFSKSLCARWDLPFAALPRVQPAHTAAGTLQIDIAERFGLPPGIPVTVGAADSVASAYAMAGLTEGVVCITMGSSTIIIDAIRAPRIDPAMRFLLTPHVASGWYGREMDLLATGTGYRWLSDLVGWADGSLDAQAALSPPGARGVTFMPYLANGEQGALWDPTLRGAICGLKLQHSARDIARAFLEGTCYEIRRCVDVLAETTPIRGIVVSGHIIEHRSSLQILADVLQQPLQPYLAASAAATGAAQGAFEFLGVVLPRAPLGAGVSVPTSLAATVLPGSDSTVYQALCADFLARPTSSSALSAPPVLPD